MKKLLIILLLLLFSVCCFANTKVLSVDKIANPSGNGYIYLIIICKNGYKYMIASNVYTLSTQYESISMIQMFKEASAYTACPIKCNDR